MSFLSLSIRGRLYWGFAAIVLFGLALSLFSGWQLSTVQGQASRMAHVADGALRVREVAERVQVMRRASLRYSIYGDEASFKEAAESETKATELSRQPSPRLSSRIAARSIKA